MAVNLSPVNTPQWFDANGVPLNGGKIWTYSAGSDSVLQTTFTDSTGTVPNANPLVLDSSGRPTNSFWLTNGFAYHFVVTNSGGTVQWQEDNVLGLTGVSSSTGLPATEVGFGSVTNQLSGTSTFTFNSGTSTLTVGGGNGTISTGSGESLTLDVNGNNTVFNADGSLSVSGSVGTAGQVLTTSGTGAAPTWTTVGGGGSNPTWVGRIFSLTAPAMNGSLYSNWYVIEDQAISDVTAVGGASGSIAITPAGTGGIYKMTISCVIAWNGSGGWPAATPGSSYAFGTYVAAANSYFNNSMHFMSNLSFPNNFNSLPSPDGVMHTTQFTFIDENLVTANSGDTITVTPAMYAAAYGGSGHVNCFMQISITLVTP